MGVSGSFQHWHWGPWYGRQLSVCIDIIQLIRVPNRQTSERRYICLFFPDCMNRNTCLPLPLDCYLHYVCPCFSAPHPWALARSCLTERRLWDFLVFIIMQANYSLSISIFIYLCTYVSTFYVSVFYVSIIYLPINNSINLLYLFAYISIYQLFIISIIYHLSILYLSSLSIFLFIF